LEEFINQKNRL